MAAWFHGAPRENRLKPWPAASKPSIITGGGSFSWLAGDPSGVARGRRGTTPKESDDLLQLSNLMQLSDMQIHTTNSAFAAFKAAGSVVSWGYREEIGYLRLLRAIQACSSQKFC